MKSDYQQNAKAIINRLCQIERVVGPKLLELLLIKKGYGGRNLVKNWQSRDHVPQFFLESYSKLELINLDWLVHGRGLRNAT